MGWFKRQQKEAIINGEAPRFDNKEYRCGKCQEFVVSAKNCREHIRTCWGYPIKDDEPIPNSEQLSKLTGIKTEPAQTEKAYLSGQMTPQKAQFMQMVTKSATEQIRRHKKQGENKEQITEVVKRSVNKGMFAGMAKTVGFSVQDMELLVEAIVNEEMKTRHIR